MSAEKISLTRYKCICELPNCPGDKEPWISDSDHIPERCTHCGRRTWNGAKKAHMITAFGKTQRISQWAKETGINKALIRYRILAGWNAEDAVSLVPSHKESKKEAQS